MRRARLALTAAALATAIIVAHGTGLAGAGTALKSGTYKGKTTQEAVTSSYRAVQFTVKKGKVTLTVEPVVAKGVCLSTPVFTLDGTPRKKLSKSGAFTFTHTYMGNKFDKISGRFVSPTEVEGFAIYHFPAQDLCSEGKVKVNFTAKHK